MKGPLRQWRNPVLPGFHPDPSVCRVGDWFYLATSSFHFFPGIPLHRSRDLVHWELGGYAIGPDQLDLGGTPPSRGLFAPTLRHYGGRFYVSCTEVDRVGNFLVSAPAIEGPWSAPLPLAVGGIDPSLEFDDEGSCWLCTSDEDQGTRGIAVSVIDPDTGAVLEGPRQVCAGSGGRWPEGPHLYRRDGRWYLLLAEGGTEYGHAVTVFRAESPWGPWEACPRNPVLTHRDAATDPIQCLGHADLVEDGREGWWLLCLGVRPLGPLLHNLGRETFLAALVWDEEGWPLMGREGRLALVMEGALPGAAAEPDEAPGQAPMAEGPASWLDPFTGPELEPSWVSLRTRPAGRVELLSGGGLLLCGDGTSLSQRGGAPALVARPQTALECRFETELEFLSGEGECEAGIVALYDEDYHYEIFLRRRAAAWELGLRRRVHDLEVEGPMAALPDGGPIRLRLIADRERYNFSWAGASDAAKPGERGWKELGSGRTAGLCTEGSWRMSFTGVHLGLYCLRGRARFLRASFAEGSPDVDGPAPACYPDLT